MQTIGVWSGPTPAFSKSDLIEAAHAMRELVHVVLDPVTGRVGLARGGVTASQSNGGQSWPLLATLPPTYPEWLGDRSFTELHRLRFPYVAGAMANGIASARLVTAMARAGLLSFFGAAGLLPDRVGKAIDEIEAAVGREDEGGPSWGANLIHSPNEPAVEYAVADLYVRRGVRHVSAAAYMGLTPAVVRYAMNGLSRDSLGRVHRKNHVFATVSRPEVARRFLEPPPEDMLRELVATGALTEDEAKLAAHLPVAETLSVESDSGGHTDNRPLVALLPLMLALRDEIVRKHGYTRPIHVGAAGGLGTPAAIAAAFALGASFVVTGSVNQAAIESGLHADGKAMLAQAGVADVVMAPAADMFELGVSVQVLARGTMFAMRARKLYEIYRAHDSIESIPKVDRERVESTILRATFDEAWESTRAFWAVRDPAEITRAESDPKHKLALICRAYLGLSSKWAINGQTDRRADYQIWCGPAMGAFNAWTAGTFLAEPSAREVVQVALNLLEGAAVVSRAQQLRSFGVPMPAEAFDFRPRRLAARPFTEHEARNA